MAAHDIVGGVVWGHLMVLMAALIFAVFEVFFALTGQRRHFQTRRRVALATCASVLFLPFVLPVLMASPFAASINATDAIVAQYLRGNIAVSAQTMDALVGMRSNWVLDIAKGTSALGQIVLGTFAIAALARLGYLAINLIRIRRAISSGRAICKTRRLQIIASPSVTVPFSTRGLRRYFVVLPESLLADRTAVCITLGHELQHIRQGDVDAEIMLALASPFLFLNPGFWFMSGRIRKLGELACDRAYLARQVKDAHSYSLRLLGIARRAAAAPSQPAAFGVAFLGRPLPWMARRSMLKSRIVEIATDLDRPTREAKWTGLALSFSLSLAILTAAISLSKPADWSYERIMLSTVVNLERINELNTMAQRTW